MKIQLLKPHTQGDKKYLPRTELNLDQYAAQCLISLGIAKAAECSKTTQTPSNVATPKEV
ncbi:hypothetical protein AB833_17330 [Chromatiales bacterium (ex Bugula neritina AB1)]|nr:hypothetical protein AB833_17330 [Chromatiales bacterium (ex Bugula neritina AB1)]